MMARFVNKDAWLMCSRAVAVIIPECSLDNETLSHLLRDVTDRYGIAGRVHLIQRDGCAVNGAAFRNLQARMPQTTDGACLSHAMNLVGKRLGFPVVTAVWKKLNSIFSKSHVAQRLWKTWSSHAPPTSSAVRWWSQHEALAALFINMEHVVPFLTEFTVTANKRRSAQALLALLQRERNVSAETHEQLEADVLLCAEEDGYDGTLLELNLGFRCDFSTVLSGYDEFRLCLAAQLDVGDIFASATYQLERDGFMAPFTTRIVEWVESQVIGFELGTAWRRADDVARELYPDDPQQVSLLLTELSASMAPAFTYYRTGVIKNPRYKPLLDVCSAARLVDPQYVSCMQVEDFISTVKQLLPRLTFLDEKDRAALIREATEYHSLSREYKSFSTAALETLQTEGEKKSQKRSRALPPLLLTCEDEFTAVTTAAMFGATNRHAQALKAVSPEKAWAWWEQTSVWRWRDLAAALAVFTPSSALAERAFSVFKALFPRQRSASLADLREAQLMKSYNSRQRHAEGDTASWAQFRLKRY